MKITKFNQNQKKELLDYLSKFKDIKDQDVEISINLISNCIDKHTDSIQEAVDVECIIKGKKCIVKHIKEYKKACIAIPIDEKEDFSNFIELRSFLLKGILQPWHNSNVPGTNSFFKEILLSKTKHSPFHCDLFIGISSKYFRIPPFS